ncbi:RNA polymerase sigma factor SigB [Ureibacillus manganicus DSM 26584]|uniref:RNA polymerase sigma factor SigB n=1 Tax=Ureibacillus manganicus DSM 26584 TaxID=1384049 RepID=A0A0A3ILY3_9BACL|nr:RNA polymerase sigma factor SigB [Ureibacillus manganicus]KGR75847.1 RNA polymerase sigma factor SigB [Ureibacillus manganicus DSM 26584]
MPRQLERNLSEKELATLFAEAQEANNEEAQTQLVLKYEYLVESIAKKYSHTKSNYDDIYQVGMIGLLGAIRRYDSSFGRNFEVFAIPTIIGEIKRFLRDKTWDVHVPRRIKELVPKIKSAVDTLTHELQRSPSIPEISDYLGVQVEDVLESMEMSKSYHALSMDKSIESDFDGSTVTLLDLVGEEETGYELINFRMALSDCMELLTHREQEIIKLTFFNQMSQKQVGEKLGISQMHVSRIQRQAIKKLQEAVLTSGRV